MEIKFNIFAGIEQEDYYLHIIEGVLLESIDEAKKCAREYAEELYQLNPVRDVLEIMDKEDVDEDTAQILFKLDMIRKTTYYVEELIEINGELTEVIHHKCR